MIKTSDKLPNMHSTEFQGLPVVIQWPKGSIRVGEKEDGTPYKGEMKADYGYIPDTTDADNDDHLDIYIGPEEKSKNVYVVEQLKDNGEFDEWKLMLGFQSLEDAEEMFAVHAGEEHVGKIEEMPFADLLEQVNRPETSKEKTAGEHTLLDAFVKNYEHEVDFYTEVASLVQDKLDSALQDAGIKAVVSSRAKRPSRLEKKIKKRAPEKAYRTFRDISDDVIDLAGVRVALYMPADREHVGKLINELFTEIRPAKHFPEDRAAGDSIGYVADHCLVKLRPETLRKKELRYADTQVEIQVASVLMHAWAEVTHDLIYKPEKGKLAPEEMTLLKELNDTVQMGEKQLEALQSAIEGRTSEDLRFDIVAALQKLGTIGRGDLAEFRIQANKIAATHKPKVTLWTTYLKARLTTDRAKRKSQ
jgi:ppGpp synthetase/RelA/SpoT-type nucleotidyltranferase